MKTHIQSSKNRHSMQNETFEIFHYIDSELDNVDVHHHDFYEICFFLSGRVQYRIEGQTYSLVPGDIMLINPMELHQPIVKCGEKYDRIVLWINKSFLDGFEKCGDSLTLCFDNSLPTHTNIITPKGDELSKITHFLNNMVEESYGDNYCNKLSAFSCFLQFMVSINRLCLQQKNTFDAKKETPIVQSVLSYINDNYNNQLSLESIAQKFYVSKYHLSHEFSKSVGTSVYRYIILKRLLNARNLLAKGESPGEVCTKCGFQDYANFYKAFKNEYGISPKNVSKY